MTGYPEATVFDNILFSIKIKNPGKIQNMHRFVLIRPPGSRPGFQDHGFADPEYDPQHWIAYTVVVPGND
jgi:hypothetical protein